MNLPSIKFPLGLRGGGRFFLLRGSKEEAGQRGWLPCRRRGEEQRQREELRGVPTAAERRGWSGHKERVG